MPDFRFNETEQRFEMEADGATAIIKVLIKGDVMLLLHTEVPPALGGKGIGSRIVQRALEYLEQHDYKLAPLCPFVAKYLRVHPEWQRLLAPGYDV